ncbi:MAG: hypothetical protein ACJ8IK_06445, partial [Burkholderiaceae bacterium]
PPVILREVAGSTRADPALNSGALAEVDPATPLRFAQDDGLAGFASRHGGLRIAAWRALPQGDGLARFASRLGGLRIAERPRLSSCAKSQDPREQTRP